MEILSLQTIYAVLLCCNCAIIFATNIYKFIPNTKICSIKKWSGHRVSRSLAVQIKLCSVIKYFNIFLLTFETLLT